MQFNSRANDLVVPWILDHVQQQLLAASSRLGRILAAGSSDAPPEYSSSDRIERLRSIPIYESGTLNNINSLSKLDFTGRSVSNCYLTDIVVFSDFDDTPKAPSHYYAKDAEDRLANPPDDTPVALAKITDGAVVMDCFLTRSAVETHRVQYARRIRSMTADFGYSQTQAMTQGDDPDSMVEYKLLSLRALSGARILVQECKLHIVPKSSWISSPERNRPSTDSCTSYSSSYGSELGYVATMIVSKFLCRDSAATSPSFDNIVNLNSAITLSLSRNITSAAYIIGGISDERPHMARHLALGGNSQANFSAYPDESKYDSDDLSDADFTGIVSEDYEVIFGHARKQGEESSAETTQGSHKKAAHLSSGSIIFSSDEMPTLAQRRMKTTVEEKMDDSIVVSSVLHTTGSLIDEEIDSSEEMSRDRLPSLSALATASKNKGQVPETLMSLGTYAADPNTSLLYTNRIRVLEEAAKEMIGLLPRPDMPSNYDGIA